MRNIFKSDMCSKKVAVHFCRDKCYWLMLPFIVTLTLGREYGHFQSECVPCISNLRKETGELKSFSYDD